MHVYRLSLLLACGLVCAWPVSAAEQPVPSQVEQVPPEEALGILGSPVAAPDGKAIGRLVDVLVDNTGTPQAGVIDVGGFMGVGARKIAVHWSVLHFAPANPKMPITLDLTLDQIKVAPEYRNPAKPAPVLLPAPAPGANGNSPAASVTAGDAATAGQVEGKEAASSAGPASAASGNAPDGGTARDAAAANQTVSRERTPGAVTASVAPGGAPAGDAAPTVPPAGRNPAATTPAAADNRAGAGLSGEANAGAASATTAPGSSAAAPTDADPTARTTPKASDVAGDRAATTNHATAGHAATGNATGDNPGGPATPPKPQ